MKSHCPLKKTPSRKYALSCYHRGIMLSSWQDCDWVFRNLVKTCAHCLNQFYITGRQTRTIWRDERFFAVLATITYVRAMPICVMSWQEIFAGRKVCLGTAFQHKFQTRPIDSTATRITMSSCASIRKLKITNQGVSKVTTAVFHSRESENSHQFSGLYPNIKWPRSVLTLVYSESLKCPVALAFAPLKHQSRIPITHQYFSPWNRECELRPELPCHSKFRNESVQLLRLGDYAWHTE